MNYFATKKEFILYFFFEPSSRAASETSGRASRLFCASSSTKASDWSVGVSVGRALSSSLCEVLSTEFVSSISESSEEQRHGQLWEITARCTKNNKSLDRSIVRSRDVIHLPWLTWLLCNRRTEDLEETQGDRTVTRNIPLERIFPSRYRKWASKTKCRVTHWAGDPCLVAAAPSDANAIVFSNRSFQLCKQQSSNQVTHSPKAV